MRGGGSPEIRECFWSSSLSLILDAVAVAFDRLYNHRDGGDEASSSNSTDGSTRPGSLSNSDATQEALERLGYDSVYNYSIAVKTPGDPDKWIAALEAKFEGKSEPFGKEQWDDLLGDYNAVRDIPASCFAPELIAAYPDAKIILTTRSTESWFTSVNETIWAFNNDPINRLQRLRYPTQLKSAAKLMDRFFGLYFYSNFPKFGKCVFEEHNTLIRSLAPERTLEFHPKDGWEPLCEFLGKEVPESDFPKVNETAVWKETLKIGESWNRIKRVGMVVSVALPVLVGGLVAWRRGLR
ncbi:uncharacterized protein PAC_14619 [Phialocephala subalpina]|uniref:NAD dependent epimerase/dehydratase n=1 Tax=Phialocephala subalpina TaxID=576137 RepID=A0A1L7XI57_9HELO|nr:uncharacterized protein PAC_14619 [Phialocephala subalpina]